MVIALIFYVIEGFEAVAVQACLEQIGQTTEQKEQVTQYD